MRDDRPATVRPVDFVIIGTPRSGTTLVQRLACELPGVRTPPETHLLSQVAHRAFGRVRFPLSGPGLIALLETFTAFHRRAGVEVNAAAIAARLEGEASSVFDLFAAVVAEMAGDARLRGEKTPDHLLWWHPLSVAFPDVKIIAVVRDPRAVVASNLGVPFGMNRVELIAERWTRDQDEVMAARDILAPDRFLLLRYEDVVADPTNTLAALAALLTPGTQPPEFKPVSDVPRAPGEYWKDNAAAIPSTNRISAWRELLTIDDVSIVNALSRRHLASFGYDAPADELGAIPPSVRLSPAAQVRRLRYIASRARRGRRIMQFSVTARPSRGHTSD